MRNLIVILTVSILDWKIPFWTNLVQENQNNSYKLKFGVEYHSRILNQMVMFTFSALYRKDPFWANLVKKFKFVCFR